MKKLGCILLYLVLVYPVMSYGGAQAVKPAGDPHMTPDERAKVVKLMLDTQKEYLDSLENLTDAQWKYKPSPFKWSVGEVAEHIVLAEAALFSIVERAIAQKPNPDWESKTTGKDAFIEKVMPSRDRKAQAPYEIRPTGKLSREEVTRRYREVRTKSLEFAQKTDLPLKAHTVEHPFPAFNTLNAYDWLIYIPLHNLRHDKQIAEVKASAGYPK
ncbi:MAG: DinB family protein [Blastocatellia bacterium]